MNVCLVNKCYVKDIKSDLARSERRTFRTAFKEGKDFDEAGVEIDQSEMFKKICVECPAPNPEDNDIDEILTV